MTSPGPRSFFEDLFEHAGVALMACDEQLRIRCWNHAAARMFGARAEGMVDTPLVQVVPPDRREQAEGILKAALNTGASFHLDFEDRDASGHHRDLACTIAPVVGEGGRRVGASLCVRDITLRMSLQRQVHESRKMVALGELAGAVAHHFNNIVGGVITSADFALAGGDPAFIRRVLSQSSGALLRAVSIARSLLVFAEGDHRDDHLADFIEVIHQLADEVEPELAKRSIRLALVSPPLPVTPVVRSQLQNILRPVIQNAVEAMPSGGTLTITTAAGPGLVRIRIHDTGCGMTEEQLSRVFEPFWTTKQPTAAGLGTGVGLGLAVAHGIATAAGGSIIATSQVGGGSTFEVTFPVHGEP